MTTKNPNDSRVPARIDASLSQRSGASIVGNVIVAESGEETLVTIRDEHGTQLAALVITHTCVASPLVSNTTYINIHNPSTDGTMDVTSSRMTNDGCHHRDDRLQSWQPGSAGYVSVEVTKP